LVVSTAATAALTDATALAAAAVTAATTATADATAETAANTAYAAALTGGDAATVSLANGTKLIAANTAALSAAASATAAAASTAAAADDAAAAAAVTAAATALTTSTAATAASATAANAAVAAAAATADTSDDAGPAVALVAANEAAAAATAATAASATAATAANTAVTAGAAANTAATTALTGITSDALAAAALVSANAAVTVAETATAAVATYSTAAAATADAADDAASAALATTAVTQATAAAASVTSATAEVAIERTAQAFTLTTVADSVVGGAGNDNVVGVIGKDGLVAQGTTLQAGDNINLGAGADTFTLSIAGTNTGAVGTTVVTFAGVETINVSNYQTANQLNTINLALANGIEAITVVGSGTNGNTAFTNQNAIVTSGMNNGVANLSVGYTAGATVGLADSAVLNISGITAGVYTSAGVETLTINSSGATANTLTDLASAYATVNINASVKTTISNVGTAATKTINASGSTGQTILVVDGTGTLALTAGSGGSSFDITADTLTKADTITGGAGADTVIDNTATHTNATLVGVTGIETLDYNVASTITLTAPTDFTTFDFDEAGNQSLILNTGYTGAVTVDITGDATNADVITNTAKVDVTIKGNANDFDAATDFNGSTATETALITADSGTATFTGAGAIDFIDVITVVDKATTPGSDITIDVNAYATALTIDATALDGAPGVAGDETLTVSNVSGAALTVLGGEGVDTIQDSAKNDSISGNGGKDVITADQGGVDVINGGAGNDTINMGATLTAADTVDGGDGTDTLNVTAVTAAALAGVTNIETLGYTAAGALSLTADLSFDSISLENANNTALTFGKGYVKAMTVLVEDGDTVINTAKIPLTISADDDELAAADNTILTGSATTVDTLNILNKNNVSTIDMQTDITNFDVVNITDYTFGGAAGNDIIIDVTSHGAAAGSLTIDASQLDDGVGALAEVLTISGQSTAALNVTGGGAGDTIALGTGADTVNAGAGKDTITAGTSHTYEDTIDGGDGTDTINATSPVDVDFQNTKNVEVLGVTTAATLAGFAQAAGIATVTSAGASTISAAGYTTGITIQATGAATHSFTGGSGDDVFVFQATETLTAADTVNGTSGNDTIRIDNDDDADKAGDAVAVTVDASVTNIDTILVNDNASTDTAGDVTVTLAASWAQKVIAIDGSALDAGETLTVVAGGNAAAETVQATGGAGNDVITTGAGKDTIIGNGGADTITGGAGADTMTGGTGSDTFAFVNAASIPAAIDTVTDFTATTDQIKYTMTAPGGTVSFVDQGDAASVSAGLSLLSSASGQYFFDTGLNQLAIDVDGNGMIQAADTIIKLTGATAFSSANMDVVLTASNNAGTLTTGAGNDRITSVVGNKVNTFVGGAGNDTYLMIDPGEADVFVEAAAGGTDTLVTGIALDIAGFKFGTTAAGATANGALTNFENLVLKEGATFTADAANFSGVSINVNTVSAGVLTIAAPGPTTGVNTLNFGGITGTATSYLNATGDTVAGVALDANDILNITGGSGVDTITAAPLIKNNITAGNGVDLVTLNTGIDKVVTVSLAANSVNVSSFTSTQDLIDLSAPMGAVAVTIPATMVNAGAATNAAAGITAVTTAANTDAIAYYVLNTAGGTGVLTLTQIETAITAGSAATGEMVLILDNGTNTEIYFDGAAQTDASGGAGLILNATLVGITGAAAAPPLATGDLISV
jgi:Ca2+-binding RTX toxin-like protein